jgi:hypothetical protein
MDRRIHRNWLAIVAGTLLTGLPTLALAQNTLSVPNTTASAGNTNVGVPVDYSGPDLTTLAVNVNFDPSFCARLVDPTAITVVDSTAMACTSDCSNGGTSCTGSATCTACTTGGCQPRVRAAHLEQPIDCASGTARIAFNNGQGGVVIGKGSGEILELNVGTLTPNASGVFTFTPASIDAHNGPLTITVLGVPGTLTILGPATTTTTTSTSSTTSSSTSTSSSTTTTAPTTSTTSSTTTTRPTTTSSTTTTQPVASTTTSTTSTTTTSPSTTTMTIPVGACPLEQGFWKNHPAAWPVGTLMLGSQTYSERELLAVLRTPIGRSGSDASLSLAHQLIAAKLSIANGSDPTVIAGTVAHADRLLAAFGGKLPYGVRPSSALGRAMVGDAGLLDAYNSGRQTPTCVGEGDPQERAQVVSRPLHAHERSHRRARGSEGQRRTWGPWQGVRVIAPTAEQTSRPEPAQTRVTENPGSEGSSRDAVRA